MQAIVYVSRALRVWDDAELSALSMQSAEKNRKSDISGYLYAEDDRFVQYIEGPVTQLLQLMGNIRRDARHQVLREVMRPLEGERRFPEWPMRRVDRAVLADLRLSHLLTDHLLLRTLSSEDERWQSAVWRLVDRLSEASRPSAREE